MLSLHNTLHPLLFSKDFTVGIMPLKERRDVTKLDLTIPLLSLWFIDIDLSIQLMSFILYMTWVH